MTPDKLKAAVDELMRHQLTGTREGMHALQELVDAADAAVLELRAERERMRRLIADDAWACAFQTFGQYRAALLEALGGKEKP